MNDWLAGTLDTYASVPFFQGLIAALATFILEDPTTIVSGLLVADGRMAFWTALIGVSSGIAIGDFGLYAIGALFQKRLIAWGWLEETQVHRAQRWFNRNIVAAVVLARFLPGSRLPTYISAGVFRASPVKFVAVAAVASLVWTFVLLSATIRLGQEILPLLGRLKWPLALGAVALFVLLQVLYRRRLRARRDDLIEDGDDLPPAVSYFEFWPPYIFYAPVALYYLVLALRYRGLMLPMNSNPSIYSGGMIRESKHAILDLVPEAQRAWFAPHVFVERGLGEGAEAVYRRARAAMDEAGLGFPVVAKPDQGQRGDGVQRITGEDELLAYADAFPEGCGFVVQALVPYGNEVGILWYRLPGEERGRIFSVTNKEFPVVRGDGRRTLRELIVSDRRARVIRDVYLDRHKALLDDVIPDGEAFPLVFAGNHAKGCIFRDGAHLMTDALRDRIDAIAAALPEFHFGRFDCRYQDVASLQRGEGFCIVEINGAGAEATHIWDASMGLREAYWTLFEQFRILFVIGAANRRRGHRPIGAGQFLSDVWAYRNVGGQYPQAH